MVVLFIFLRTFAGRRQTYGGRGVNTSSGWGRHRGGPGGYHGQLIGAGYGMVDAQWGSSAYRYRGPDRFQGTFASLVYVSGLGQF